MKRRWFETGTPDNPEIVVQWHDGTKWTDVTSHAKKFTVEDEGIADVPTASVTLYNKDGQLTTGSSNILFGRDFEIKANIRGAWDSLFYGTIYGKSGDVREAKRSYVTVKARDWTLQKLQNDTITKEYSSLGYSCRDAILDFLSNPDSGIATGVALNTDDGAIKTETCPKDFDGENLLECLKIISEEINYVGWTAGAGNLYLYPAGSKPCSPAVALAHPYARARPVDHIAGSKNYIFVWGGTDTGFPVLDLWMEYAIARYDPPAWGPLPGGNVVVLTDDVNSRYAIEGNRVALKASRFNEPGNVGAGLLISRTGYAKPQDGTGYMDFQSGRFSELFLYCYPRYTYMATVPLYVSLFDIGDRKAERIIGCNSNQWNLLELGVKEADHSAWDPDSGFDWYNIKKIYLEFNGPFKIGEYASFDLMKVLASSWKIDPFKYPTYDPPITDDSKIPYPAVYHHRDDKIQCFEHCRAEGLRILNSMKNAYQGYKVTLSQPKTWVECSQTLTFTLPEYGVNAETWRVTGIEYDWNSGQNVLKQALNMAPSTLNLGRMLRVDSVPGVLSRAQLKPL